MLAGMSKKATKKQEKAALAALEQLEASVLKQPAPLPPSSVPPTTVVFEEVPDSDHSDEEDGLDEPLVIEQEELVEEELTLASTIPPPSENTVGSSDSVSGPSSFSDEEMSSTSDFSESDSESEVDSNHLIEIVDETFTTDVQKALEGTPLQSVLPVRVDGRPTQQGLLIVSNLMPDRAKPLELAAASWIRDLAAMDLEHESPFWFERTKLKYGSIKPKRAPVGKGYPYRDKVVLFKYRDSSKGPELNALDGELRDVLLTTYGVESK